jgi:hypothetical protein
VPNNQRSNRFAAWLAILGIALNALWPLLANASPRPDSFRAEICSLNNLKAPQGISENIPPAQLPAEQHPLAHCVFCASGVCAAPLTGASFVVVVQVATANLKPYAADSRPGSAVTWLLAPSRAPPVLPLI